MRHLFENILSKVFKHLTLVGLPGFAQDCYCQFCHYVLLFLCLFISLYLCISVSPLYLSISPKPNLTLNMPACWSPSPPTCPSLSLNPLYFQIRNSLMLRLIFFWTNSFIYKIVDLTFCWFRYWNFFQVIKLFMEKYF